MYKFGVASSLDPVQKSKRCERLGKETREEAKSEGCWVPTHTAVIPLAARGGGS